MPSEAEGRARVERVWVRRRRRMERCMVGAVVCGGGLVC